MVANCSFVQFLANSNSNSTFQNLNSARLAVIECVISVDDEILHAFVMMLQVPRLPIFSRVCRFGLGFRFTRSFVCGRCHITLMPRFNPLASIRFQRFDLGRYACSALITRSFGLQRTPYINPSLHFIFFNSLFILSLFSLIFLILRNFAFLANFFFPKLHPSLFSSMASSSDSNGGNANLQLEMIPHEIWLPSWFQWQMNRVFIEAITFRTL
jgi:hypothetical protein